MYPGRARVCWRIWLQSGPVPVGPNGMGGDAMIVAIHISDLAGVEHGSKSRILFFFLHI